MRTRDGNPLTWIARALELAPTEGPVHLVLAELMHVHRATSQAMLHLRLAAQYDRTLGGAVSVRAPVWAPSVDLLMQAIPDGPYGDEVLLDACANERASERRLDCLRRATRRSPGLLRAQLALAESLLLAIRTTQPQCKDKLFERCAAEAEVAIRSAARLDPKAWRPGYLLSKVVLARGDSAGAAQLLTRTCPKTFEGDECWHEALAMAMQGGSIDTISAAANVLAARPCDGNGVVREHVCVAREKPRNRRPGCAREQVLYQGSRSGTIGRSLAQSRRTRRGSASQRSGPCGIGSGQS